MNVLIPVDNDIHGRSRHNHGHQNEHHIVERRIAVNTKKIGRTASGYHRYNQSREDKHHNILNDQSYTHLGLCHTGIEDNAYHHTAYDVA